MTARLHKRRRQESGFALLFILLIAAGIAISMYMELPRIAFETQRNREELLMQRGHEYQRAVGLYLKKYQRYPSKIEDLESTNNLRFLRRRYIDPMTGKDDWRMIHAGPGGMLTDSLIKRKSPPGMSGPSAGMGPGMNANNSSMDKGGSMNVDPSLGSSNNTDPNQPQEVNAAMLRRASDRSLAGVGTGTPGAPGGGVDPNAPQVPPAGQFTSQFQGLSGQQPAPPAPGQPGFPQPGQPGTPGFTPQPEGIIGEQPAQPADPNAPRPGLPGLPGMPPGMPGLRPGFPPQPLNPQQQPSAFNQQPQVQPGSSFNNNNNNTGVQTVNNSLNPQNRGLSNGSNSAFNNGATGGGIAGVASKFKGPSIKVYDEQQRYEKWEFVYDPKKDSALTKNLPASQAPTGLSDPAKPADPRQP